METMEKTYYGESFQIETPKGYLGASLHQPTDQGNGQIVVMLHGFSGNRYEVNGLFERTGGHLASLGFHVLRFDFRGCGESHGTTMDICPSAQVEDTFWAIEYVQKIPELAGITACHILGFSFGGVVATLCALERPELFKSLTIWEGPFNLGRELKKVFAPINFEQVWAQGYFESGSNKLSAKLFEELDNLEIRSRLATYSGPVLLITGDHDPIVPSDPNHEEWLSALTAATVTEKIIHGADHGFTGHEQEKQAIELTTEFLQRLL